MSAEVLHSLDSLKTERSSTRLMRILVAHNVSRARTGGMSRMLGLVHDQFVHAGHMVDYFCSEDLPARFSGRFARFSFPILVRRRAVLAARAGRPYHVINVHEPVSAAVSVCKASMGNPLVLVTSHGIERRGWEISMEELALGRDGPSLKTRLLYPATSLWQSRLGLLHADHIFCLSFQDRDYLTQRLNIPCDKITRIYPASAPIYATVATRRDYQQAGRLLFFGTWLKRKGTEDLVAAFKTLTARHPKLELVVVGAGITEEQVRGDFPDELRERVKCLRTTTEESVAAVLAATDIFVLPSLFEGTPQTLIEAMTSGMPVVTTATSGMRDVIDHGRNGLLVPIRSPDSIVDAVERLLGDSNLRASLGRTAHKDAHRNYSWERVAAPVLEAYEHLAVRK